MPADKSPAARAHTAIDMLVRTCNHEDKDTFVICPECLKAAHDALDEALREARIHQGCICGCAEEQDANEG